MLTNKFLKGLRLTHPVMQAPMGGGPSTPELIAAVCDTGGMGWLAGAYLTPEQIRDQARAVRAMTDRPFGINLFVGGWARNANRAQVASMMKLLKDMHAELGLAPPSVPGVPNDPFPGQLEAVLDAKPAAFSFTFGLPRMEDVDRLKAEGIAVLGTATTLREARILAESNVDAIVAQGEEAGAHRGTFAGTFEQSMVPTLDLVRAIHAEIDLPVVAAGGLMDGRDVARALEAGASATMHGTAFLATPESGASDAYKRAILSAEEDDTVVTRAFSGRPARGLRNSFVRAVEESESEIPPYPLQNVLTRPMRQAAAARGDASRLSLWAGRGVARTREAPAAEIVAMLLSELEVTHAKPAAAQ
ncbi:MAG TPA: nitronate monooxygenase [Caulobacteraceae bacterium]|nr:nitronate monooxygenase [Caulobacteraceae bacterium]